MTALIACGQVPLTAATLGRYLPQGVTAAQRNAVLGYLNQLETLGNAAIAAVRQAKPDLRAARQAQFDGRLDQALRA